MRGCHSRRAKTTCFFIERERVIEEGSRGKRGTNKEKPEEKEEEREKGTEERGRNERAGEGERARRKTLAQ